MERGLKPLITWQGGVGVVVEKMDKELQALKLEIEQSRKETLKIIADKFIQSHKALRESFEELKAAIKREQS